MSIPSDEEIRNKIDVVGDKDGVRIIEFYEILLTRYEAFRFSRFLENAIHDSCRLSGEKIDQNFEHGRE